MGSILLAVGLPLYCGLSLAAPQTGEPHPPNVLLIAVDDLNDWVGALGGHPQARTPHLDQLASSGRLFTNAHCQAPVCTPSRASLFTGLYPSSNGMYFLQPALSKVEALAKRETLIERFAEAGYSTLGVGKLYHGGGEAGYFQTYGGGFGGFGPYPDEKISHPIGHPLWDWGAYPESDGEMPEHAVADWAIERLLAPRDEPFFLAAGFWRPHVPMYAPERWFDVLGPEDEVVLPTVPEDDPADLPAYARALTIGLPAPRHEWLVENDQWRAAVHAYLACTAFVDAQIGRVLTALEEGPHAENTIVVLFSDHGFHLGEKSRWAKRSLWEESTRVPLIIAGPGIEPGTCGAPVELVDLFPTLLEMCGLESEVHLDGDDLGPLLADPGADWDHPARTTFGPGNHALRTGRWRYIRYADGSEELYDHDADPGEWHNLASAPEHADVLARLRKALPSTELDPVPGTGGAGLEAMREAGEVR